MTMENMKLRNGDNIILNDGLIGKVIDCSRGQIWNNCNLSDAYIVTIKTICGIETVTNNEVSEIL